MPAQCDNEPGLSCLKLLCLHHTYAVKIGGGIDQLVYSQFSCCSCQHLSYYGFSGALDAFVALAWRMTGLALICSVYNTCFLCI